LVAEKSKLDAGLKKGRAYLFASDSWRAAVAAPRCNNPR